MAYTDHHHPHGPSMACTDHGRSLLYYKYLLFQVWLPSRCHANMEPLDLPGRGRTASQEVLQDAAVVSSPGLGRPHDAGATHDPHHTTTVSSSSPSPVSPMATGTPKRKKGKAEACTRGTKRVSSRAQPARKRFMPSKYDSSLPVNSDGSPLASTEPRPRPPSACLSSGGHSPSRIQLEQVKHTLHDVQSTTGSSYAKQRSPSLRPSRPPNSSSTASKFPLVSDSLTVFHMILQVSIIPLGHNLS
nr:uncharacterized protein LOC123747844 [Procambarus clarkii]